MKKSLFLIVVWALAAAGCGPGAGSRPAPPASAPMTAQRHIAAATVAVPGTYVIVGPCAITGCTSAVTLNGVNVGTVSYSDGITYFIPGTYAFHVTFLGTTYTDGVGSFTAPSANLWVVKGTFNGGADVLTESFNVAGHSGRGGGVTEKNLGGTVVVSATPTPTPTPTPIPTPTATPTPTPTPTPTAAPSPTPKPKRSPHPSHSKEPGDDGGSDD